MKRYAHRIGAVFFVLWGILHVAGGAALLQELSAGGVTGVLASLGSAVPAAELPAISGGVTAAVLAFFSFNWIWIGLVVLAVGARLNWVNSVAGYWLNLSVAGAADLGLLVFLLLPGYMAPADGWPGPLLWVLAAIFSTIGLVSRDAQPAGQVAAGETSPLPG